MTPAHSFQWPLLSSCHWLRYAALTARFLSSEQSLLPCGLRPPLDDSIPGLWSTRGRGIRSAHHLQNCTSKSNSPGPRRPKSRSIGDRPLGPSIPVPPDPHPRQVPARECSICVGPPAGATCTNCPPAPAGESAPPRPAPRALGMPRAASRACLLECGVNPTASAPARAASSAAMERIEGVAVGRCASSPYLRPLTLHYRQVRPPRGRLPPAPPVARSPAHSPETCPAAPPTGPATRPHPGTSPGSRALLGGPASQTA